MEAQFAVIQHDLINEHSRVLLSGVGRGIAMEYVENYFSAYTKESMHSWVLHEDGVRYRVTIERAKNYLSGKSTG